MSRKKIPTLAYAMARSMINFAVKRSNDAMLVSLGFLFMFLGQLFFLFSPYDETRLLYVFGHFVNLIGFLFLLIMLAQMSRVK